MQAKMTNVSTEAAVRLSTLIESHAHDAGRELGDWLRPYLRDGEELPDFSLVLQLPARVIEQAGHFLRESQKELDESRSRESEARASREQRAAALRRKLVEIRQHMTPVFGSRAATLLGIEGKTARSSQSALLSSQADAVLKVLRDPKRLAKAETAYFDPAPAAAALEPLIVASREAGGHLDEVCQASAARLEARDRARAELHRGIHWVVRMLSGWLGLVRRADLAKKLRRLQRPDQVRKARNAKKSRSRKEVPM